MSLIRPCPIKSLAELNREWDELSSERHRQITSGEDISFHRVVVPTVHRLIEGADFSVVLDIGSGTGDFTIELAKNAGAVVAVEPSERNMKIARALGREISNIQYVRGSLEESVNLIRKVSPTSAVAVMTLMTVPDLSGFAAALASVMPLHSHFVAVFTHPCFWSRYWGYHNEEWFDYRSEIFIEAPFIISKHRTNFITTHIHRPLETYVSTFARNGFEVAQLLEPFPTKEVQALYPTPWEFPRFIGISWRKAAR